MPSPWIWGNLVSFVWPLRQKFCFETRVPHFCLQFFIMILALIKSQRPSKSFSQKRKYEIIRVRGRLWSFILTYMNTELLSSHLSSFFRYRIAKICGSRAETKGKAFSWSSSPSAGGFYGFNLFRSLRIGGANHPLSVVWKSGWMWQGQVLQKENNVSKHSLNSWGCLVSDSLKYKYKYYCWVLSGLGELFLTENPPLSCSMKEISDKIVFYKLPMVK